MSRRRKTNEAAQSKRSEVVDTLFYNSQFNTASHEMLLKQMKQEFEKKTLEDFFQCYISCLRELLVIGEKHATVERSLEFGAKFGVLLYDKCSNESGKEDVEEEMSPFLKKLFNFLFEHHQTRDHNVRFRICQFINKLLNNLGEEASLDDELCNKISTNMLERLQDKVAAVRAQAVMALQRLQDPSSPDCVVIKAFLFHLGADPSAAVRRSVLACIGRSNITLPHILERTRDIKDTVRRHAYLVLTKLSIRSLTIKQRERLLREGLKDRSELVSNCVGAVLLPTWLRNMKGNYLDLLHALDVENSTETSILALKTLLKHRPLKEVMENLVLQQPDKIIPLDKLTSENALYWRCLAQHLHAEGGEELEDELEKIIPNLTPFCQYIRRFYLTESPSVDAWLQIQSQFVVLQLLELTKVFDLADEVGRSNLKKLLYDLLICTHVKKGLVPVLVELLVAVDPNVSSRLQFLAEIVSEVHEPMTQISVNISSEELRKKQLMQAKIRVQLNEIGEEQETAVREQEFVKAQMLLEKLKELREEMQKLSAEPEIVHKEVREERNDRATLSKCLTIIYEMVQSPTVSHLTPHLRSLMENFVIRYIEDCDTYIHSLALQAMGVFCLLDKDLAKQYILMFFFQIANNESDEVCIMALKVIFDFFMLYGLQTFQMVEEDDAGEKEADKTGKKKLFDATELEDADEDEDNITTTDNSQTAINGNNNFITILTSLLDSTSSEMRTVAAEGLCKLLLAGRIKSSNLVSQLLVMWYNPVTEGDIFLRQMLGAFFSTFASNSQWGQETLEQAFLPTLRTLFQAPVTSPLVEVDQDSVVRLLLNLTRNGINQNGTQGNVHNNLAIALCNEILVDSDPYNTQVLLRALTQLELVLEDPIVHQNISTVAQKVADTIKEKLCLRHIQKFQHMLAAEKLIITTTSTNVEGTNTVTVTTSVDQHSLESVQASSVGSEIVESDSSDPDEISRFVTPHPVRGIRVVPETLRTEILLSVPDICSDMVHLDGEVQPRTPSDSPPRLRRSGRVPKRKSQKL